jgi:glycosyltransferase involved in cell wall biosynthesis
MVSFGIDSSGRTETSNHWVPGSSPGRITKIANGNGAPSGAVFGLWISRSYRIAGVFNDSAQTEKMTTKLTFIERKYWHPRFRAFSLENVFSEVSKSLTKDKFDCAFVKLPYGNSTTNVIQNLVRFRVPESDIYHITGHVHYIGLRLPIERSVLTIHDLGFLHRQPVNVLRRAAIKKFYLDHPIGRLNFITAVSHATKSAIIKSIGCSDEKIRVIYNPVQTHFLSGQPKAFNKDNPTILQIGVTENKNIARLIAAVKGIRCRLKFVGDLSDDLRQALVVSGVDHIIVSNLDDEQMMTAYAEADIVSFCSTYEGFGLPIIEAQAMYTPVLTSDLDPMKEVSGGAAYLADPFDVESIRNGILRIINDDQFREEIIERGRENIQRFLPDKIAAEYERLYDEILER